MLLDRGGTVSKQKPLRVYFHLGGMLSKYTQIKTSKHLASSNSIVSLAFNGTFPEELKQVIRPRLYRKLTLALT